MNGTVFCAVTGGGPPYGYGIISHWTGVVTTREPALANQAMSKTRQPALAAARQPPHIARFATNNVRAARTQSVSARGSSTSSGAYSRCGVTWRNDAP